MCGSKPKVVRQDPEADAAAAAAKATAETNISKQKRRTFNNSSMLGSAMPQTNNKSVLGGG